MCKYCDLDALEADKFDSFFGRAFTGGINSMVCKYCSTTFLTNCLTLGDTLPADSIAQVTPAEERRSLIPA